MTQVPAQSVPFDQALRHAIAERGLTLERIADRLDARGMRLSVATLSLWQTGRCRPERPKSLQALSVIEEVLQVQPGALFALLGPPRPRGRWAVKGAQQSAEQGTGQVAVPRAAGGGGVGVVGDVPLTDAWSPGEQGRGLWERLDTRWDLSLTRLSCHSRLTVDADRCVSSLWSRRVVRAEADGVDRWITVLQAHEIGRGPELEVPAPLRLGAVEHLPDQGLLAAELLFDRALARGETAIVEYTVHRASAGRPVHHFDARLNRASREHLLEVRFDRAARPGACRMFRSGALDAVPRERSLRLNSAGTVHAVALGAGPGRFGIRWDWDGN
ncbi:transcriptional regulator with XRE-family HTH domain [Streptacidiphilus sp. BW17]|uniref:helix-turn-helix domain-containing protein n=1 Tax=Streptacidiphilus sp. BW17 TaxID=3156274 RepID=UPI003510E0DE